VESRDASVLPYRQGRPREGGRPESQRADPGHPLPTRAARADALARILARMIEDLREREDPSFGEEVPHMGGLVHRSPPGTMALNPRVIPAYDLRSFPPPQKTRMRNQPHRLFKRGGLRLGCNCLRLQGDDLCEAKAGSRDSGVSFRVIPVLLPTDRFPVVRNSPKASSRSRRPYADLAVPRMGYPRGPSDPFPLSRVPADREHRVGEGGSPRTCNERESSCVEGISLKT